MLKEIYSFNEELIKEIHEKAETVIQRNVSKRSLILKYRQDLCMAVAGDLFIAIRKVFNIKVELLHLFLQ